MREDILNELNAEYALQRDRNEKEEAIRRERIQREFPEIHKKMAERENLIYRTIHQILDGNASTENLEEKMNTANKGIAAALKKSGLPKDYLEPVFRCAKCKDTGYTGELLREPCECLQKAYQRKIRDKIGLRTNSSETFENYNANIIPDTIKTQTGITQREQSEKLRKYCEKWANNWPKVVKRDILLSGASGLGKTFMLRAMAARLIERGVNVLIVSSYTFLRMARKDYFEEDSGLQELEKVSVLMLDDLGTEPLMQNISVEHLYQLINERQSRGLSTIISTNLTLPELLDRYTERISSRLIDTQNCTIFMLEGKDLRKSERQAPPNVQPQRFY